MSLVCEVAVEKKCVICYDKFTDQFCPTTLCCKEEFCTRCLAALLVTYRECPFCHDSELFLKQASVFINTRAKADAVAGVKRKRDETASSSKGNEKKHKGDKSPPDARTNKISKSKSSSSTSPMSQTKSTIPMAIVPALTANSSVVNQAVASALNAVGNLSKSVPALHVQAQTALAPVTPSQPNPPGTIVIAGRVFPADYKPFPTKMGEHPCTFEGCNKLFAKPSALKRHLRTHTGEKPFPCPSCPRAFAERGNLRRHYRVHTGERPFPCPWCGHAFARKCHLIQHQEKGQRSCLRKRNQWKRSLKGKTAEEIKKLPKLSKEDPPYAAPYLENKKIELEAARMIISKEQAKRKKKAKTKGKGKVKNNGKSKGKATARSQGNSKRGRGRPPKSKSGNQPTAATKKTRNSNRARKGTESSASDTDVEEFDEDVDDRKTVPKTKYLDAQAQLLLGLAGTALAEYARGETPSKATATTPSKGKKKKNKATEEQNDDEKSSPKSILSDSVTSEASDKTTAVTSSTSPKKRGCPSKKKSDLQDSKDKKSTAERTNTR